MRSNFRTSELELLQISNARAQACFVSWKQHTARSLRAALAAAAAREARGAGLRGAGTGPLSERAFEKLKFAIVKFEHFPFENQLYVECHLLTVNSYDRRR